MTPESGTINRRVLLGRENIANRIAELGQEISIDYKGKKPLFVGVLKGSFVFMADLLREIDQEVGAQVDFMAVSSYGRGTESSRQPKIEHDLSVPINSRHVLVVEDIVDTGYSFKTLLSILSSRGPASLKTCVLLSKPSRREVDVPIDYRGFEIPNKWVEGFGLDTDEDFRGLKDVMYRELPSEG